MFRKSLVAVLLSLAVAGCTGEGGESEGGGGRLTVRAWHFPDIVHSAAMVGRAQGAFEEALGPDVKIHWTVFNAGPSAIEALFAGEVDIGYIGPSPAINGYIKSRGEALRIVCGASSGGAGLVVRRDAGIETVADLEGKRIATPQLGNTQDVVCRAWLKDQGFELLERGGTVQVIPVRNPDQLTLFLKKEIDGAWTKEPWVARLIDEGGGTLFLDERTIWPERQFVTAHIIVRRGFLEEHPDLVEAWIRTHIRLTEWINSNPEEARAILNQQIAGITGRPLPENVLSDAFTRTTLTYDPISSSLFTSAQWAWEAGFLGREKPDISGIYELSILNRILSERGLEPID